MIDGSKMTNKNGTQTPSEKQNKNEEQKHNSEQMAGGRKGVLCCLFAIHTSFKQVSRPSFSPLAPWELYI